AFAAVTPRGMRPVDSLRTGAALASGLLSLDNEAVPLPQRALSVPLPLGLALSGQDGSFPGTSAQDQPVLLLSGGNLEDAQRHAAAVNAGSTRRWLVIRSPAPPEGRAMAIAIAGAIRRRPLFVQTNEISGLGPYLLLRGFVPVFCFDLAP